MSQQRFYRVRDLTTEPGREGRLPISRSTLWRWVAAGHFPPPVRLSEGITAWPAEAVEQWEKARQGVPA